MEFILGASYCCVAYAFLRVIEKCNNFGNDQVMLCERGTSLVTIT